MPKLRVSTTVDANLLGRARDLDPDGTDSSMLERALRALLDQHRRVEIDEAYRVGWAARPFDEPDEWGDLASWSEAVSK